MIGQSEIVSHHKYTLGLLYKLGQQPRLWHVLTLERLPWTLKETEKRSSYVHPCGGCRAVSFRLNSQTSVSRASAAADNRNRLPSIVQTSIEQEKRPRLLQWVLQICADSRGKLHRGGKPSHTYLRGNRSSFRCANNRHILLPVCSPHSPRFWVLWPAAS